MNYCKHYDADEDCARCFKRGILIGGCPSGCPDFADVRDDMSDEMLAERERLMKIMGVETRYPMKGEPMTREEAIAILKQGTMFNPTLENKDYPIAFEMAIQALTQECVEPTQKHVGNALDMRCDDAISRNQSNACSILDDECPYPHKRCWECSLKYQYELAKHELGKNNELSSVTQKSGKWIPVSERLPEEFTDVFCSTDAEEVFIATYLGKMNDGVNCFDDDNGMMCEGDVIAWMPLPKPYEPQERSGEE